MADEPKSRDDQKTNDHDDATRDDAARRRRALIGLIGSIILAVFSAGYVWLSTRSAPGSGPVPTARIVVWAQLTQSQAQALRALSDEYAQLAHVRVELQQPGDLADTLPKALYAHIPPDVVLGGSRYLDHLGKTGLLATLPEPKRAGKAIRVRLLATPSDLWEESLGLAALVDLHNSAQTERAASYVEYVADRIAAR